MNDLRKQLVEIALAWEKNFGNSPQITSAISEYDDGSIKFKICVRNV